MSAQFAHMDAQRPMPSAASASAHMMHACMHAESASMHSCIIIGSMPLIGISDDDIAPFIMSIVMFIDRSLPGPASADRRRRRSRLPCSRPCYAGGARA
ncbi:hypothetical protein GCM10009750_37570 [Agromyces salentinus]|uniref:DUF305 domain-containing protein n=1 Tax=Agromyces salentinus TaxID=269421 RepID=A0ABN2N1E4_9MICO